MSDFKYAKGLVPTDRDIQLEIAHQLARIADVMEQSNEDRTEVKQADNRYSFSKMNV